MHEQQLKLHEILCDLLGSRNVYFQPPPSIAIKYPAIVYSRDSIENRFANNKVYHQTNVYSITVIHASPIFEVVDKISQMPTCRFVSYYISDNLNHNKFTIYL